MKLSVVLSTLNNRERLCAALDELATVLGADDEVIVVNGPSTDGTTGTIRARDDVDVLVEISERSQSVSRNAGLDHVRGDAVAFLDDACLVESGWRDGIETALSAGADVVTGPVTGNPDRSEVMEVFVVAGRAVTPIPGNNVAFSGPVLDCLDGFDEYLDPGSTVDCAHRLADGDFDVVSSGDMTVRWAGESPEGEAAEWGKRYRSIGYRLAKNYGIHPAILARTLGRALLDGFDDARCVLRGETALTGWVRNGVDVTSNALVGLRDGLKARYRGDSPRRNPRGVSSRQDRAVQVYDRR
ncbi:glycosyl transferase [Halovivax ruber XH-70]|uniref:Glycosyl transferase n=1 Tax=Halovivax ruber (strain DSM 18193 / JCM 13892 / XH-70) TaxID=797302 RepID=L0ID31_HALRX|nr:glycosyltransferase [Halovivax ruber]AGB15852.1 glycosyl transferase [Halovivax ruber XH-70]